MRIYFLNPPYKKGFVRGGRWQGVVARAGTLYYPISLAYSAGTLENEGHRIRLVDAVASNWSRTRVIADAQAFRPDLVVVDSNFSSLSNDTNLARQLKECTGAVAVIVGPPTSRFADKILSDGLDVVARLEYDFTLLDIAETLEKKNGDLASVKGISFMQNGKAIHNPDREFSTSDQLDSQPFVTKVYRNHLRIRDYFLNHALYPMVQIFTGRGCPNACTFCSWPQTFTGRKYRVRNVKNVVDEFEYVRDELPAVREVFIEDDTFSLSKKRIFEFVDELTARNVEMSWGCQSRADLDYETIRAMKKAGCRLLDVGYESGSDKVLEEIKKGTSVKQLRDFTSCAKKARMKILADFVIGFQGETKNTAEETIRFVRETKPNLLQVAVATPIPGTEFFEWCRRNGYLLTENMEESLDGDGHQKCIVSYPWLSDKEIERYVNKALKEFYLSPSYLSVVLRNVLDKNALHEAKIVMKSVRSFLTYIGGAE